MKDDNSHLPAKRVDHKALLESPERFKEFLEEASSGIISKLVLSRSINEAKKKALKVQIEEQIRAMKLAYDTQLRAAAGKAEFLVSSEAGDALDKTLDAYHAFRDKALERYIREMESLEAKKDKLPSHLFTRYRQMIEDALSKSLEELEKMQQHFIESIKNVVK